MCRNTGVDLGGGKLRFLVVADVSNAWSGARTGTCAGASTNPVANARANASTNPGADASANPVADAGP